VVALSIHHVPTQEIGIARVALVIGGIEFSRPTLGKAMRSLPISGEQRLVRTPHAIMKNAKLLAIVGATLLMSLMLADGASAKTVKMTKTVTDDQGNTFTQTKKTFTDDMGDRSTTVSKTLTDAKGDKVTKTGRFTDNGFQHCKTISISSTNASGDKASKSMTKCGAD
jgi:hypothetical protein